jgi:hypothetical protein
MLLASAASQSVRNNRIRNGAQADEADPEPAILRSSSCTSARALIYGQPLRPIRSIGVTGRSRASR